jgi:hypothetical protein
MRWSADELLRHEYFREYSFKLPEQQSENSRRGGGGHLPLLAERRRQSIVLQNSFENPDGNNRMNAVADTHLPAII